MRGRRFPSAVLCGLVSLAAMGCVSSPNYFGNRAYDLAQVFDVDAGVGVGVQGYVGISHALEFGLGSYDSNRVGLRFGEVGAFEERRAEIGIPLLYLHQVEVEDQDDAILAHHWAEFGEPGYTGLPFNIWSGVRTDRVPLDVSLEAHPFLAGFRLRVHTLELLDLLAGLVTWDPAGDDLHGLDEEEQRSLMLDLGSGHGSDRERAVRKLRRYGVDPVTHSGYYTYSWPYVLLEDQAVAIGRLSQWMESRVWQGGEGGESPQPSSSDNR